MALMKQYDSLIFDMDGTLWDAVDSYVRVWDATFDAFGMRHTANRENLVRCMGQPIEEIYRHLVGDERHKAEFLPLLAHNENTMMATLGGILYPGVREYIPRLAERYRLFMVSNCGEFGLPNFLKFTGLGPYFTDTLSHGQTGLLKSGNIRRLIEQYGLKSSVYIGDTAGDCVSAHEAGIDMMHAAYGFGTAPGAEYMAASFEEIGRFFLERL